MQSVYRKIRLYCIKSFKCYERSDYTLFINVTYMLRQTIRWVVTGRMSMLKQADHWSLR